MTHPDPDKLEQMVHQALRALPERRAPLELEQRVLAAIAARRALPWWRQSFAHWPLAARGAFLVLSAVLAAVVAAGFFHTGATAAGADALARPAAWLGLARTVAAGIGAAGSALWHSVASPWLYGALALVAVMYAALIGLGATACRLFLHQR